MAEGLLCGSAASLHGSCLNAPDPPRSGRRLVTYSGGVYAIGYGNTDRLLIGVHKKTRPHHTRPNPLFVGSAMCVYAKLRCQPGPTRYSGLDQSTCASLVPPVRPPRALADSPGSSASRPQLLPRFAAGPRAAGISSIIPCRQKARHGGVVAALADAHQVRPDGCACCPRPASFLRVGVFPRCRPGRGAARVARSALLDQK